MKTMRNLALALALAVPAFGLAACGTSGGFTGPAGGVTDERYGYNPQQYLNINQGWADMNSDGVPDFIFTGGKQGTDVQVSVLFDENGKPSEVRYSASDLSAIAEADVRAAVEIAVAEQNGLTVREITPELRGLIETVVERVMSGL